MNKTSTSFLSSNFIREISNVMYFSDNVSYLVLAENLMLSIKVQNINLYNNIYHLKPIRKINLNKLVVALNVNSIRKKFEALIRNASEEVDLLMISETAIDESFPKSQFLIKGFSDPFRIDRNVHGGGIFLYFKEDIPTKLLSIELIPSESFFVELDLRK